MKIKKTLSLLILSISALQFSFAQTNTEYEKLKSEMWGDPDFKVTAIPDKWKDESAVILAKSYEYEVKKEVLVNYIHENISLHKRVKLLDKSSVNEFSELSFQNDYENTSFWANYEVTDISIGVKVVKASGKEQIVDLKDAVINEIKQGYRRKEYKKIAVPDLEIGDIIDYFYVIKNTYQQSQIKVLDPVFYQLVDEYPTAKQKFNVRILRQMYFNSKAMNGAPELKQTDKDDESNYSFTDGNRDKRDANIWTYRLRIYPTLKFQAFYVRDAALNALDFLQYFLGDKKTNNSKVDLAHIDDLVKKTNSTYGMYNSFLLSAAKTYINTKCNATAPQDTVVKYLYYYFRQKTNEYGSNELMLHLSKMLETKNIKHDLVITIPNFVSDISDLILPKEVSYLIRVKGNPDYFIGDFSPLSLYKSISSYFQGNNAYAVSNPMGTGPKKVEKIVIPVDQPDANTESNVIHAKFAENNMDSVIISVNKSVKGEGREDEIPVVVAEINYLDDVDARLNKPKSKPGGKKSKKELAREKEKKLKLQQQLKDCEKALTNNFKYYYNAGEDFKISSYTVKQMGVWDDKSELKYDVNFTIGNLIKKMGPNYMVEIGKLITQQLELSKKDMERKVDVYAPYPRTFEYKIVFEIPASYQVKGLDKLNVNVANETGGFVSTAKIQDNNLVVDVKKYYSHKFEKASEWPKMVEFIEAAYNFTQTNILLAKK